ncbi:MAG: ketopantoate reductase family protein [Desulfobacterales bacterium]|jgi:2-dehydropantoate 2-reductase
MKDNRMAVVGIGATGTILAAALLGRFPDTFLVGHKREVAEILGKKGIRVSGALDYRVAVKNCSIDIKDLNDFQPACVFLCCKTFHLESVLEELRDVFKPQMKIISTQNGLGPEDLIANKFGRESAFRMSLNYGAALKAPGEAEATFFNRPNHLGSLSTENQEIGSRLAASLTDCGLDTEFVADIKLFVWKKMIMKCTMASICAVTDKTIKEALQYPPTREIADACFDEALTVAGAMGYNLGADYLQQALGYLEKVGAHKDSMCDDIKNQTPTEIDFLGAKVVEYARSKEIAVPYYTTMTNLVKAIEHRYLGR